MVGEPIRKRVHMDGVYELKIMDGIRASMTEERIPKIYNKLETSRKFVKKKEIEKLNESR